MKRNVALSVAVLAAAAFGGGAYAATQTSAPNPRQAFLADVAKRLNVTPVQLHNALRSAFFDQLSAAVADGRLTQTQANRIRQRVLRTGAIPFRFMFGFEVPMTFKRSLLLGGLLASAKYLGVAPPALFGQLRSGKSLAQVAAARGKSVSALEAAIMERIRASLHRLVAAQRITRAREQRLLARVQRRLDQLVNRTGLRLRFLAPFRAGMPPAPPWPAPPLPVPPFPGP